MILFDCIAFNWFTCWLFRSLQERSQWQIQGQTPTAPSSSSARLKLNGKILFRNICILLSQPFHMSSQNWITRRSLKSLFLPFFLTGLMVNTWCSGRWRKAWTWSPRWNRLVCMTVAWSRKLSSLTVGRSSNTWTHVDCRMTPDAKIYHLLSCRSRYSWSWPHDPRWKGRRWFSSFLYTDDVLLFEIIFKWLFCVVTKVWNVYIVFAHKLTLTDTLLSKFLHMPAFLWFNLTHLLCVLSHPLCKMFLLYNYPPFTAK